MEMSELHLLKNTLALQASFFFEEEEKKNLLNVKTISSLYISLSKQAI